MPDFAAPKAFAPLDKALELGGENLLTDFRRLESILADIGGQDKLGCNLAVMACRSGIPSILRSSIPPDEARSRSVSVLVSNHGLSKESSEWTVAVWTVALINSGIIEDREFPKPKPASAARKPWEADPEKPEPKGKPKPKPSNPAAKGPNNNSSLAQSANSAHKPRQSPLGNSSAVSTSADSSDPFATILGCVVILLIIGAVGFLGYRGYLHFATSQKISGLKAKASEERQAGSWGMYRLTLLELAYLGDRDTIKQILKTDFMYPSLDERVRAAAERCARSGDVECRALLSGHRLINQNVADDFSSFNEIRRLAEAGSSIAMSFLGRAYLTGTGVKQDEVYGIQRLRIAASSGDAFATALAGAILYFVGSPLFPKGSSEGLQYLDLAGTNVSLFASSRLAIARVGEAKDNVSRANAIALLRSAALNGDPHAHLYLANYYESGITVRKDMRSAYRHAAAGANLGNPRAMVFLGRYRLLGLGIEKDNANAVYWLQEADRLGDPYARALLAYCSLYGAGMPKSSSEAYRLAKWAAASSDVDAKRIANSILNSIPKK